VNDDAGEILGRWARSTDPRRDPITESEVRARALLGERSASPDRHGRRWVVAAACALAVVALGAAVLARGGDDGVVVRTGPAAGIGGSQDAGAQDRYGTISVQLEQIDGLFIEGFEVGLRFETNDGEVIATRLWSDLVAESADPDTGEAEFDAWYDSVLTQQVPVGAVVVRSVLVTGMGPPYPVDVEGELPCRLDVDVAPGETVAVEVRLDGERDMRCLRLLDESAPATTTTSETPVTTMPLTTTSIDSSPTQGPTTTAPAAPSVGVGYHVDVDLDCNAFELSGIWALVEGDPRSWQPAGERHEGGTFTLDSPTTGRFVGDAAETKVATFRLLSADEEPTCLPLPR
jgi:hypothetical protein